MSRAPHEGRPVRSAPCRAKTAAAGLRQEALSAASPGRPRVNVLDPQDARPRVDGEHGLLGLVVNGLDAVRPVLSAREDREAHASRVLPAPDRRPSRQSEGFARPSAIRVGGEPEHPSVERIAHSLPDAR